MNSVYIDVWGYYQQSHQKAKKQTRIYPKQPGVWCLRLLFIVGFQITVCGPLSEYVRFWFEDHYDVETQQWHLF